MYLKRLPRKKKKALFKYMHRNDRRRKMYHADRYRFKLNEAIKNGTMILSLKNGELRSVFPRTLKARQNSAQAKKLYVKTMEESKQKMILAQIALITPSVSA